MSDERPVAPEISSVEVGEGALTTATWGDGPPEIVLLHDGLGSIGQWRDVPARIAAATGRTVVAYDRAGHGSSTPAPTGAWPADWLHGEAKALSDLLDAIEADRPLLVGHSDGGSIALLAAAGGIDARGVVSLAAHTFVEQVCVDAITEMRAAPDRIVEGLARHHDAPAAVFEAWSGVWTGDAFRTWDVRDRLGAIEVPVVVAQGDADEYATLAQVDTTVDAIGANARAEVLPGVGHLIHHQAPGSVVELVADAAERTLRL